MMRPLLLLSCFLGACHPTAPARDSSSKATHAQLPPAPSRAAAVEDLTHRPRVALVIGNGDYQEVPKLENAPYEARHVAARLAQLDFDVELVIDADRATLMAAIDNLAQRLKASAPEQPKAVGLLYFSGHGLQYRGQNYLLPLGAGIAKESELPARALEVDDVLEKMEAADNAFNIVVLDACRDNPYAGKLWPAERAARGLVSMNAPKRTLLAYPAAPGHIAREGEPQESSVFTRAFLRHIARPGIPVAEALDGVGADVQKQTDGKQVPWRSADFTGAFAFTPCPDAASSDGLNCGTSWVECDQGTWDGERCVLEKLACPPGFEMVPNEGCRLE